MKNSRTRIFDYEDKKVVFDRSQFNFVFNSYRKSNNTSVMQLENDLASSVFLSREAIHNWRNGYNGPSDIQTVKLVAGFLKVSPESLLVEHKEKNGKMKQYTNTQLESLKRLTDTLWEYIYMFIVTEGFSTYVDLSSGEQGLPDSGPDYQDEYFDKVTSVFQREYFTLHGLDVYVELEALANDISSAYDEDYRFMTEEELAEKALEMYQRYADKWRSRLSAIIRKNFHEDPVDKNQPLSERQRNAFKRVYNEILDCMERIKATLSQSDKGPVTDPEMYYSFQMEKIDTIYKQESFDLLGLELYEDLDSAIYTLNSWVDRLRPSQMYHSKTTEADVIKHLHSLVDKYI